MTRRYKGDLTVVNQATGEVRCHEVDMSSGDSVLTPLTEMSERLTESTKEVAKNNKEVLRPKN